MRELTVILSVILLSEILMVSGCFVTNCPPGGKRSGTSGTIRQCQSCGSPRMNGRCYGRSICCSSEGCLVGTSETSVCIQEDLLHRSPCQNPGESCSGDDETNPINGQCAASGICCSTVTCTTDANCVIKKDKAKDQKGILTSLQPSSSTIFQNPLDLWIPRRLGLASREAINHKPRKYGHMGVPNTRNIPTEVQFLDRPSFSTDYMRHSNEEY